MDKSTLKMLLIVTLVFFGFMLLTKPKAGKDVNNGNLGDSAEAVAPTAQLLDSIRPADVEYVADFIRLSGEKDPENGSATYRDRNVTLTVNAEGNVEGEVAVSPDVTVTYDQIVNNNYPADLSINHKTAANRALRDAINRAASYQCFARYMTAPADGSPVELQNPDGTLKLQISRRGGYISRATLTKYYTYFPAVDDPNKVDTADVVVLSPADNAYYNFTLRTMWQREIRTDSLYFTPRQVNDSTLEMVLDLGGGAEWGYRYSMKSGSYIVGMEIFQHGMQDIIPPSAVTTQMRWHANMRRQERGRTFEERNSALAYKYSGDSPDELNSMKNGSERLDYSLAWVAYKNQFFSTVMIPRKPFDGGDVAQVVMKDTPDYLKSMDALLTLPYDNNSEVASAIDIYIGPNLYPTLKHIDDEVEAENNLDLTRLIPLGWSWLRWINTLIVIPVFTFLSQFGWNYGIIILLLTLFIKLIIFPFTYKSYISQAKMRLLAPEIKEINDKYPGQENAMVRQQKTMALYSSAGASPFSGCLPLLLQMPILIAMFSFFPSAIELRGQSFLWAKDLAAPDSICTLPFTIPFYGNHVSLFCLLMTATNIIYTRINMKNQPSSSTMPGMKWMMYLMPLMFLFFFNDYAAALSYYYFLSLLITIIQTWVFRKCINEQKMRRRMLENAKKPKKKSGFMARLEEAQRKQQAILREQQKASKGGRR